jgi:hypothetical protein
MAVTSHSKHVKFAGARLFGHGAIIVASEGRETRRGCHGTDAWVEARNVPLMSQAVESIAASRHAARQ